MFLNSGRKIKVIAKVVFIIGIVLSVLMGIVIIVFGAALNSSVGAGAGTTLIILGILDIPIGGVIAYVVALFLSGYGQIVENTDLLVGRPEEQAPAQPISANQVWQSAKTTASGVVNGVKQGVADAHAAARAEQPQPPVQPQGMYQPQPPVQAPGMYQPQPSVQPQEMYQPQPSVQPQEMYQPQPSVKSQEMYQPQPSVQPQEAYQPQPSVQPQEAYQPQPAEEASILQSQPEPVMPEPSVPESAAVKYCGQCGTPNEADYEFCINCGNRLD